jgi:hypothetical protein
MKKLLYFFLFATLLGCGVASNLQSSAKGSGWYPVNMKPSQVETDGSVFYSQKLDETEYIEVYYDSSLYEDGAYYYNQLMASYGWTPSGGGIMIASAYASKPSYSALHISVKRGVAIYMYPDTEYRVFRVARRLY